MIKAQIDKSPARETAASTSLDPFLPSSEDLTPCSRLLRLTKTGEKLPVTLRMTRQTTAVSLNLSIPPLGSHTSTIYGIEYDDPTRGKHEGIYEGQQVFTPRQKGVGAGAILLSAKDLRRGYTFAEALSERYDVDIPGCSRVLQRHSVDQGEKDLVLGSSGGSIKVEAPGLDLVQKRIGQLRRLQIVGLEDYRVCRLGGDEDTRTFLKENLTSLRTLDLSNNLIFYWEELAEIISCTPSLRKIILNNSRVEILSRPSANPHLPKQLIREAFSRLEELELCNCCMTWSDVMQIAPYLPRLHRLDLVDNSPLTCLDGVQMQSGEAVFRELKYLNLAGCSIANRQDIVQGLRCLPKLDTLDISNTPLTCIPPLQTHAIALRTPNLIMLNSNISTWSSIANLQEWTGNSLISLKYSLSPSVEPTGGFEDLSGKAEKDRPVIIALLSHLTILNSTPITAVERRDAEMFFLRQLDQSSSGENLAVGLRKRYKELKGQYGTDSATASAAADVRTGPLKSKLITLSLYPSDPNDRDEAIRTISVLPSTPISLLRKKVSRLLGGDLGSMVRVWTVKAEEEGGGRERAVEAEEGENVGWWFADGDGVIVDLEQG